MAAGSVVFIVFVLVVGGLGYKGLSHLRFVVLKIAFVGGVMCV